MALYIIGIGLNDEKDISVKGLEAVKKCSIVYLEGYTSKMDVDERVLSEFYGKDVRVLNREDVEQGMSKIVDEAKSMDVAFLVIGDVFSATTHISMMLEVQKKKVKVEIVHNASILTAVGVTGLELYKFGKVTSIPFDNENVKEPVKVLEMNQKNELHTLFLLDLMPDENKLMIVSEAAEYLIKNGVDKNLKSVACANLGSAEQVVKTKKLGEIAKLKLDKFPQCLIIPAKKLHFVEDEALKLYE